MSEFIKDWRGGGLLGGEDIAKEDLFDVFGLDTRALNGSYEAVRFGHKQ
jgi:hypothetical protein